MAVVTCVGLATALGVTVVGVIWPSPDRHLRGLLVVLALTIVIGLVSAGLRVIVAARWSPPEALGVDRRAGLPIHRAELAGQRSAARGPSRIE